VVAILFFILLIIVRALAALLRLLISLLWPGLLLARLLLTGLTALLALARLTTLLFLFHIVCHEKFLLTKHESPRTSN
jgi:hypothetical protein